jgi:hypothetical protein
MLLGFIVSERGIEANPEKIAAITNMGPIKDLKGVQRVMGCLAALPRCRRSPLDLRRRYHSGGQRRDRG